MLLVTDHEADDAIGTLAIRAAEQGIEATIVTADRDFFQLVRPGLRVLFNRRGSPTSPSWTRRPSKSGTASRRPVPRVRGPQGGHVRQHPGRPVWATRRRPSSSSSSAPSRSCSTGELKGKLKENIEAAGERLALNKNLARIVTDVISTSRRMTR